MFFPPSGILVTVTVTLTVFLVTVLAATQYRQRTLASILAVFAWLAKVGEGIRQFKDDRLESWVDKIPLSADTMTTLRFVAVGISLDRFIARQPDWAIGAFAIGWLLDLFDGLKASAETKRRGHPTKHGKYFDPTVDLLCFTMMIIVLGRWYPSWLIVSFAGGLGLRIALFLIIVTGRRFWGWAQRLPSDILPHSIAGQFKTVFATLSFGLVLLVGDRHTNLAWASWLLALATGLEMISLPQLGRRVWRDVYGRPKLALVPDMKKTGTE